MVVRQYDDSLSEIERSIRIGKPLTAEELGFCSHNYYTADQKRLIRNSNLLSSLWSPIPIPKEKYDGYSSKSSEHCSSSRRC